MNAKERQLLVEKFGHCYFLHDFGDTVIIDYYKKKFPPIQKKQGVNNCFETLILSVLLLLFSD